MTGSLTVRRGRPFRALGGLALLLALWLGWRMPVIGARFEAVAALVIPRVSRVMATSTPMPSGVHASRQPALMVAKARPRPVLPARPQPQQPGPVLPVAITPPLPEPPAPAPALPPASLASPEVPASAPSNPQATAFRLAQSAYDRLRDGERRQAAALFDAALRLADNPQWRADRVALGRRWQLGSFALVRDGGSAGPAASPVLGGGQIGGSIAFLPDPYARRPLALVVRGNVAADPAGVRGETAQAAIGIRQALAPGVSISAERLIAIGDATRSDWTVRVAAGGVRGRLSAYGEAGLLGSGQAYGGAQATTRIVRIGSATLGAGAWASLQTGAPDVWRVDTGPSFSASVKGVRLQADWRQRVAGNAAPGSGPVVTISAGF